MGILSFFRRTPKSSTRMPCPKEALMHAPVRPSRMTKFKTTVTQRLARKERAVQVFVLPSKSAKPRLLWSEVEVQLMRELKAA